ncbi:MAG TPA: DEAD/DEAH box helicase, partial [Actinomycetota bacterium]|nr:DEAD/DEAH box helicase [Actinomycetota bacterium]
VNAPWSLAIKAVMVERLGMDAQTMYSDDGIVIRLPEADEAPTASSIFIEPDEVEQTVTAAVGGSALFSSRFRECAARALLIPRRAPGRRTPLWQQRQRSADLLQVASSYGSFPIILETMRECLQDVFDVPGLTRIMRDIQVGAMKVVEVDTVKASPFAGSLLFGYIGAFLYDSDLPLAERRAQVLSLDSALLAELMGSSEMKDLIEPDVLDEVESELRRSHPALRLRGPDDLHDLLRVLGELSLGEIEKRGGSAKWLEELSAHNRVVPIRIASTTYWCAVEDAARFRDGLGVALPVGLPVSLLTPVPDALGGLLSRWARVHGPFTASDIAARFALDERVVTHHLSELQRRGQVRRGSYSSRDEGDEWCDVDVMRAIRRRSLAKLRSEVEPVPQDVLTRAVVDRHEIGSGRGTAALLTAIGLLQGYPLAAKELERIILPCRVTDYSPAMLDPLLASGEVVWVGRGAAGAKDGWVSLHLIDDLENLLPAPSEEISSGARKVVSALSDAGASFFRQLADVTGMSDQELTGWLWEAAWAGWITNDSMLPLRAMTSGLAANRSSTRVVSRPGAIRQRRVVMPSVGGRWSLLPRPADPGQSAQASAMQMLDRHGVLTRGAVVSEKPPGGFSAVYRLLRTFEEAGRCRRGYFVEGLGAAQFALPGAVDSMRSRPEGEVPLVLAATDPANPYGAALDWPDNGSAHRPGRKVGACVVLVESRLSAFVEKGGRSVLLFTQDPGALSEVAEALAGAVRRGWVGPVSVERVDGLDVDSSALAEFLIRAGFKRTSRGLRLRG